MHFWVSATRSGFQDGFCCPRKIGTNWFMPALVKSRFGASGKSDDDGTTVCLFSRTQSRDDRRIWAAVMMSILVSQGLADLHMDMCAASCPRAPAPSGY